MAIVPDAILVNARFYTLADDPILGDRARPAPGQPPPPPVVEALAVWRGRIAWLGDAATARRLAGPGTAVIDLAGGVALPGFHDAHNHLQIYGLSLDLLDVAWAVAPTIAAVCARVREAAGRAPAGAWILGRGYDNNRFPERRHPTRGELDAAAPDHPVFLSETSGHMGVANRRALALAGITRETADPPGGRIVRDAAGEPTGLLQEKAQELIDGALPPTSLADLEAAIARGARRYVSEGITSTQDALVGAVSRLELQAWQNVAGSTAGGSSGGLPLRVRLMLRQEEMLREEAWVRSGERRPLAHAGFGARTGLGDGRLRLGPMKFFADGSLIGRTAAVSEAFAGEPQNTGFFVMEPEEYRARIVEAHRAGWQTATHAIGDRAIALVLDAIAEAQRADPRPDARHRIEHCGVCTPELLDRIRDLGAVPVPQQPFISQIGDGMVRSLGRPRADLCYPMRSFLARGIPVPGSSDRPVVDGNPLLGIRDAVVQKTASGEPYAPAEAVSVAEALRMYTLYSAWSALEEREKGSLEVGKWADVVALDRDPHAVPPDELTSLRVTATVVGGEVVYRG